MNILRADFRSPKAAEVFSESLQTTGFGVVSHHPISADLIQQVYHEWKDFFASENKQTYLFHKKSQAGYFPFKSENAKDSPVKDLKEFFHIYKAYGIPRELSTATFELFTQLENLGATLLDWLDKETPEKIRRQFSQPLSAMTRESLHTLFRIIHYPPLTSLSESDGVRAAAHEDINLITLLPASLEMGLQVKDAEGAWHNVAGEMGEIVINVGDMLQEASQGFYRSTTHRVINPLGEAAQRPRYSMPLFLHPRPDVRLSEKYTAGRYLEERLQQIGLK